VGCLPRAAREALEAGFLRPWAECGGDAWPQWLEEIGKFRAALANLLGGRAAEYCPQTNLSSGLVKLLSALPRAERAPRVLLAAEDSFPSLGFVLREAQRHGFELRLIPRASPPDELDTWSSALGSDVRLALVTHVHSNTGRVAPAAQIARLCARRGILCVLDVAQSAGILPMDLESIGADVALGSCIKWRCGGPGAGWMWIRGDRIAALEPADVGWFSHADPFEMDIHSFRYADDARRFWGGTPSVASLVIAAASVAHIASLGVEAIHAHNRRLVQTFRDALPAVWRPRLPAGAIGGTLCVPLGDDFDAVTTALKAIDARFDSRGDAIRLSFHACNTTEDAVRVARAWRGEY
jgi:selenocysteine lyase/cysteine desulfurase